MKKTILLYNDYYAISDKDAQKLIDNLSITNAQLTTLLQHKNIKLDYAEFIAHCDITSDVYVNDHNIVDTLSLQSYSDFDDDDFIINIGLIISKYDNVWLYDYNLTEEMKRKVMLLGCNIKPILPDMEHGLRLFNTEDIIYNSAIQPLILHNGCTEKCKSCASSESSAVNIYLDINTLTYVEDLFDIYPYKITHFVLNILPNSNLENNIQLYIDIAEKYNVKYIITIAPNMNTELILELLMPYIDVLMVEVYEIDNDAYTFNNIDIRNLYTSLSEYKKKYDFLLIFNVVLFEQSSLKEIINMSLINVDLFNPTLLILKDETTDIFNTVVKINNNLLDRKEHDKQSY